MSFIDSLRFDDEKYWGLSSYKVDYYVKCYFGNFDGEDGENGLPDDLLCD